MNGELRVDVPKGIYGGGIEGAPTYREVRWDLEMALNDSEQSRHAVVYEVCEPPLPKRQAFCGHWVGSWQAIRNFARPCGLGGRIVASGRLRDLKHERRGVYR